jgi:uracil-DNA glycosylase
MELDDFNKSIHTCTKCKELPFGYIIKYYPIVSFGNPLNKSILVVGLNPSTNEYKYNFVKNSTIIEDRHTSQMDYFKQEPYQFFINLGKFFENPVKDKIGWIQSPWEKIGYLDIVKCPTRKQPQDKNQWGSLSKDEKRRILLNCSPYLKIQLRSLTPKLVMAYGADLCRWFYPKYEAVKDAFTVKKCKISSNLMSDVILIPQNQIGHSTEIIEKVKKTIVVII